MPEDERNEDLDSQPPGPQPEEDDGQATTNNEKNNGPGVNKQSEESFPASDPPSW
jgi:hypothetical protein